MTANPSQKSFEGAVRERRRPGFSAFWVKQFHNWHWISSGMCLVGMILFAITGITLNHAADIEAQPSTITREAQLPAEMLVLLREPDTEAGNTTPTLGQPVTQWLRQELAVNVTRADAEWSGDEVYFELPAPGLDAWLSIDLATGAVVHEKTDRGWIAYFNDLHKGRDAGAAWTWFIDIFAAACIVFCLTGLLLLQVHARKRPATWPIVAGGLIVPALVLLLTVHR
ncbi:PepSY-associated TM helix domain-containing protein [Croceicoccus sp. F390]|uniref:PepSY-associated TM helix domain-containing protein n=1 Tax=Croceicoccus esteveae TaxID=3075597 RepID=A0ABU2ZDQ6_9SPHN|nr:PepSY-associated TM helix domain-containing protein [Croceicoccus sp. F390]MDT0574733.1 PepSY-associated TM helix domain-containing protein [Croceicoccus sp. F390]